MTRASKKTIWTFGTASLLNDFGSDMIQPIWPIFLTEVLKANMVILGFIDGLGDALVSISQAGSGYLSDRIRKRKLFIWLGYLFAALSRIGYVISKTWQGIIPFRILDRAGKIRDSPRDAIVADLSNKKNRGYHFGIISSMDKLGAVLGVIASMILISYFSLSIRTIFWIAAIPGLISFVIIILFIREKKDGKIRLYKGISLKQITPSLKRLTLLSGIFSLGAFSYSFLIIYAKNINVLLSYIPLLYLIYVFTYFISPVPFGKLSDKIGRKKVMALSFFFWILTCLSAIFISNPFLSPLVFALFGLHKGSLEPVQKSFVAELSPKNYRASVLGGFNMLIGLTALPASLLAGILWTSYGSDAPFYLSISLTIISLIMLISVKKK